MCSLSLTSRSAERTAVFLWIKNLSDRKPREIKMKMLLFLLLMGIVGPHCTSARESFDSLRWKIRSASCVHGLCEFRVDSLCEVFLHCASSGVPNFPEFVVVGLFDEVEFMHYDSNTKRVVPKQDWMLGITDEVPEYWERETGNVVRHQQFHQNNIEVVKQRLNLTGVMYGCDWDDETGEVKGFEHFGFDGEDFLILDLETESYIAPRPEAVLTKQSWDKDKAWMAQQKYYYTQYCPEYLKKNWNLGRSFLMRTDPLSVSAPEVPLLSSQLPRYRFLPGQSHHVLEQNGEELHDNVDHGEILPNHNGSFQMSVDLNVSSFPAEHWDKYRSLWVKDQVIRLDSAVIRTNRGNPLLLFIIGAAVAALALLLAGIGFLVYRKRNGERPIRNLNLSHRKPREIKMLLFLLLLGIVGPHCTSARTHSMKYFLTASSGVPNFPEFVIVELVDEVQITHYDSNTKRAEPKQDWMKRITAEDPQYWETQSQFFLGTQQGYTVDIETVKQTLNQLETLRYWTWRQSRIAPRPEAVLTKQMLDKDNTLMAYNKYIYTQECPDYLKKYVNIGRSSLMRTVVCAEIPSVSLLQKSPSSPVSCHATGFYPDRAIMFWTEDGEELHDNVDHGEILPNHDGSFQMSVDLNVSSFPAEHWDKYRCVFQLSGVKEDQVIRLDSAVIRTNRGNPLLLLFIIGAAVAALALLVAGIGFLVYRKRNANESTPSPASSSELTERLNQPSEKPREIKMLLFLLLLGIVGPHCTSARTHSMTYLGTASSGVPNLPEFVMMLLVDEVQITHYDSNTKRAEPKQDWMKRITAEDPQYWETQSQFFLGTQQGYTVDIETVKQTLNQTGEDFLILDLETESWIAPKPQAVFTKQRWDKDKPLMAYNKYYYTQYCPEYLKKYVNLGRSSLMRTEIPSVSLLQKSPSSPVSCHATGFYPDRAIMFWTEDGEELHDNVDHGEILPNHDGSFQMSVDLNVSSFPAEHWDKYRCVFQLSGVKEDQVIRLDSAVIRTNRGNPLLLFIIGAVAALALLLAGIGFLVYRKRNANESTPSPASSSELTERLNQPSEFTHTHTHTHTHRDTHTQTQTHRHTHTDTHKHTHTSHTHTHTHTHLTHAHTHTSHTQPHTHTHISHTHTDTHTDTHTHTHTHTRTHTNTHTSHTQTLTHTHTQTHTHTHTHRHTRTHTNTNTHTSHTHQTHTRSHTHTHHTHTHTHTLRGERDIKSLCIVNPFLSVFHFPIKPISQIVCRCTQLFSELLLQKPLQIKCVLLCECKDVWVLPDSLGVKGREHKIK
ncbi:hypothetical protein F7725_024637 [Dissostichus mawsoni]|uniref:Ig-like domain-containing protein n=1 Tax=Dissostichus mawsoni TaxID=36200 RepID=A0A7J5X9E7_DISMA|nr:hypothetical protein F7725_024637 [Dissostichus mawsoni]